MAWQGPRKWGSVGRETANFLFHAKYVFFNSSSRLASSELFLGSTHHVNHWRIQQWDNVSFLEELTVQWRRQMDNELLKEGLIRDIIGASTVLRQCREKEMLVCSSHATRACESLLLNWGLSYASHWIQPLLKIKLDKVSIK